MNDASPWIDPELVAAGQLLQSKGLVAPDRTTASLAEVRAATDRIGAFLGDGSVPLAREQDVQLPGPHGQVPCRLYLPDDAAPAPLLVYAHGGGFMQGSIASWDHFLRDLVRQSGGVLRKYAGALINHRADTVSLATRLHPVRAVIATDAADARSHESVVHEE